jgi:hypothetical protein
MAFIAAALIVSWGLLWLYDRSHPGALGLLPTLPRIEQFFFGLAASATIAFLGNFAVVKITSSLMELNPEFTITSFFDASWWMLKSVLTEELLFRGALLYIAIRIIGLNRACILSAVAFGIYHWFSYGVLGSPVQMIYVFLVTGIAGLMFAYAFAITKSMYFPIALHLGWNLIVVVVFSQGPLGEQMLIVKEGHQVGWLSLPYFLYQIATLPAITWLYLKRRGPGLRPSTRQGSAPS